jgi:hypothetical protein
MTYGQMTYGQMTYGQMTYYEESVVVRFKSNLLLMIFWFYMFNYNS